jgi:hypothetical protein
VHLLHELVQAKVDAACPPGAAARTDLSPLQHRECAAGRALQRQTACCTRDPIPIAAMPTWLLRCVWRYCNHFSGS